MDVREELKQSDRNSDKELHLQSLLKWTVKGILASRLRARLRWHESALSFHRVCSIDQTRHHSLDHRVICLPEELWGPLAVCSGELRVPWGRLLPRTQFRSLFKIDQCWKSCGYD